MNDNQENSLRSNSPELIQVDLVVVIDTSDSMRDEAVALSAAVEDAIEAARQSCPSNLKVWWFGIEGTWPDTKFTQSYRHYLHELGVPDEHILGVPRGKLPHQGAQEEGAAAIVDIAHHFNWRPGASYAIFFLGDEALKGGNPHTEADIRAADRAIKVAQENSVKVFTYVGTKVGSMTEAEHGLIKAEYARVAAETGGQSYEAPLTNVGDALRGIGGFKTVLTEIICASAGGICQPEVKLPEVEPRFDLYWGDGEDDQIETDDIEVLRIVASNPYPNIILKDVTIILSTLTRQGEPIADLPDGTPSVNIAPSAFICFGDLPPCDPEKPEELVGVTRELVLISRGAIPGQYLFSIECCYSVEFTLRDSHQFTLNLVAS